MIMKNFDYNKGEYVEQSKELESFFKEIESTCKKYGYSISHEDGHGSFEIEKYSESNMSSIKSASLRF